MTMMKPDLPWYGVGTPYDGESPEEFMEKAKLNWHVDKRPTFFLGDDQQLYQSSRYALIRTDTNLELSSVTEGWEVTQNSVLRDFIFKFSEIGSSKDIYPHSAGELDGGRTVWIVAYVNDHVDLFKGKDRIDSFLLFIVTHQYGMSISISYLPKIMRCSNVIRKVLGAKSKKDLEYRISHRNPFDPDIAYKTMNLASQSMTEYAELAEYLGSKRYTNETLAEFLMQVYPSQAAENNTLSRPAKQIMNIIETMPNADVGRGTWWAALNAVTYYSNHVQGRHQKKRWASIINGSAQIKNTRALELSQQYAEMT